METASGTSSSRERGGVVPVWTRRIFVFKIETVSLLSIFYK